MYLCCSGRCLRNSSALVVRLRPTTLLLARPLAKDSAPRFLNEHERLLALRRGEKIVAVFAGVSLLVGYFALKKAFSNMAAKPMCRPLVVAGPSGSGKSTLIKRLFQEFPNEVDFSVSHTSRKPRSNEVHGREYYFSTREEMELGIKKGEFIETAEYSGNLYGTSKKAVAKVKSLGKVCVLDIDMQGVRSIKETKLNPIYVFIQPPSIEELEKRLRSRQTETEESLRKRLDVAHEEMEYAKKEGSFDHVVVNDELEKAYGELKSIVMKEIDAVKKSKTQSEN
ncbi:PREDICTED: guanylate kinase-like [Amphimedon queenslandica]|uniref:guanylate kinase n=1 Tax=Amphimedon queenslandica TaxID=400682 RepID=A0A1X7UIQ5_AMPQE|nr:PREDICTED: guanylate kinase-like [Amphimedon queenslandica]|eukprot:XP_003387740.2 PREDICTED: guanylate kinase-like [Amphimedon queenslandica]